jgi:hypothetical protein
MKNDEYLITKDTVLIAIDSFHGSFIIGKEYPIVAVGGAELIFIDGETPKKHWFYLSKDSQYFYGKYFKIKESIMKPRVV